LIDTIGQTISSSKNPCDIHLKHEISGESDFG
jgi:hypothetical protein